MIKEKPCYVYSTKLNKTFYDWTYEDLNAKLTKLIILMSDRNRYIRKIKEETDEIQKSVYRKIVENYKEDIYILEKELTSKF